MTTKHHAPTLRFSRLLTNRLLGNVSVLCVLFGAANVYDFLAPLP